jgi:hypothetical protein
MNARTLSMFTTCALALLVASLYEYLKYLYCGYWALAGVWFIGCAVNCNSLRMLEEKRQLSRALDEVDRVKRSCLAFMLQLPGEIYFTLERRTYHEEV